MTCSVWNTSVSCTPCCLAFTRSTSRIELRHVDLVAGEHARELRVLVRLADALPASAAYSASEPQIRAVLDVELEAAQRAEAADRRRREHGDVARPGCALNFMFSVLGDGTGRRAPLPLRSSKSVEREEHERGSSGCCAKPLIERPANCTASAHARLLLCAISPIAAHDCVRAVERGGGRQLHDADEILLVLLRNEARRHDLEHAPGEREQPA